MFTHCIWIFQSPVQLCIGKKGIAFTDSPQHFFKCFNLCYVNQPRYESRKRKNLKYKIKFTRKKKLEIQSTSPR